MDKITTWINDKPDCHRFFPIWKEVAKLPKQWVVNVSLTVLGDPFRHWVRFAIEQRNRKVAIQKDLNINFDQELAAAFKASTAVSRKYLASRIFSVAWWTSTLILLLCSHQWHRCQHAQDRLEAQTHQGRDRGGEEVG